MRYREGNSYQRKLGAPVSRVYPWYTEPAVVSTEFLVLRQNEDRLYLISERFD